MISKKHSLYLQSPEYKSDIMETVVDMCFMFVLSIAYGVGMCVDVCGVVSNH